MVKFLSLFRFMLINIISKLSYFQGRREEDLRKSNVINKRNICRFILIDFVHKFVFIINVLLIMREIRILYAHKLSYILHL